MPKPTTSFIRFDLSSARTLERFVIPAPYFRIVKIGSPCTVFYSSAASYGETLGTSAAGQAFTSRDGENFGELFLSNEAGSGELVIGYSESVCVDPSGGAAGSGDPSLEVPIIWPTVRNDPEVSTGVNVPYGPNLFSGTLGNPNDDDNFATPSANTNGAVVFSRAVDEGPRLEITAAAGGTPAGQASYIGTGTSKYFPAELAQFLGRAEAALPNYAAARGAWEYELRDELQADFSAALTAPGEAMVFFGFSEGNPDAITEGNGLRVGFVATGAEAAWRFVVQDEANSGFDISELLTGVLTSDINELSLRWGRDSNGNRYVKVYVNGTETYEVTLPGTTGPLGSLWQLVWWARRGNVADTTTLYSWHTLGPKLIYREF